MMLIVCVYRQKTAYEVRISDWSSDVCSSDLRRFLRQVAHAQARAGVHRLGGDVAAVEHDLALVGRDQADDHVEAGGLAGAVGAEQADDFARVQGQAEVAHDLARAVALAQSLGDEHYSSSCFGGSASPALLPSPAGALFLGSKVMLTRPPPAAAPLCTWPVPML